MLHKPSHTLVHHKGASLFFFQLEYTVLCSPNWLSLDQLNSIKLMWEGDVWKANTGHFRSQACWLDGLRPRLHQRAKRLRRQGLGGRRQSETVICCAYGLWVNSIIIFEVVIMWLSVGWGGSGAHPASDSRCSSPSDSWLRRKVWSKPPEAGSTQRGPSGSRSQSQQTSKPLLTQEESKNNMEEVVMAEMRLMKDGASAHRSWTVLLTSFLLSVSKCQSLGGTRLFPLSFNPVLSLASHQQQFPVPSFALCFHL